MQKLIGRKGRLLETNCTISRSDEDMCILKYTHLKSTYCDNFIIAWFDCQLLIILIHSNTLTFHYLMKCFLPNCTFNMWSPHQLSACDQYTIFQHVISKPSFPIWSAHHLSACDQHTIVQHLISKPSFPIWSAHHLSACEQHTIFQHVSSKPSFSMWSAHHLQHGISAPSFSMWSVHHLSACDQHTIFQHVFSTPSSQLHYLLSYFLILYTLYHEF